MALVSQTPRLKPFLRRLVVALTAAAMAALVSEVAIRFGDTYLTNHGHAGLRQEIDAAGFISAANVILLVMTLLAGVTGWILSGPKR